MDTQDLFPREPLSISLEFLYEVNYKARSWTNERKALFVGRTDITLATAAIEDMPVVYRLKSKKPDFGDPLATPFATGDWVDVRFHENRFYVEHDTLAGFVANLMEGRPDETHFSWLKTPSQTLEESVRQRDGTHTKVRRGHEIHDEKSLRRKQDGIKYVIDDKGESTIDDIRSFAKEILVADGRVFRAVAEPVVHVSTWDASFVESTKEYHHSRYRFLHSTVETLPISRFAEVPAGLKRKERLEAEVVRADLAVVVSNVGLDVNAIWEAAKEYGKLMHEMPREWAVALAALNRTLDGSPLHPTPALVEALEGVARLKAPSDLEFARLAHLAKKADFRMANSVSPERIGAALNGLEGKVPGWILACKSFLDASPLLDRTDSSFCTIAPSVRPENVGARVRPARSLADLRAVAEVAGIPYAQFLDRVSDEGLDVFIAEGRWSDVPSPGELLAPVAVAIFDRESGAAIETHVKPGDHAAAALRALDAHVRQVADREPEFSRSAGMTP